MKLPITDPQIKLDPTIKLIGNLTVSSINRFTLLLLELFCMPMTKNKNKQELNENIRNNFLNLININFYILVIKF